LHRKGLGFKKIVKQIKKIPRFSFLDYAPLRFYNKEERGAFIMSTHEFLLYAFYSIVGVVLALVARTEWRTWLSDRLDATLRTNALRRLWRRLTGMVILVTVLVLLRYPSESALTAMQMALKILVCLTLCVFLFALALWDLRTVRHQMKREVKDFLDNSSEEFEKYLQEHLQNKKS
jgi:hypothetical protein